MPVVKHITLAKQNGFWTFVNLAFKCWWILNKFLIWSLIHPIVIPTPTIKLYEGKTWNPHYNKQTKKQLNQDEINIYLLNIIQLNL